MIRNDTPLHDAEQILDAIGHDMGIEHLSFDAQGHRALLFASGRHFGFQKIAPGLLIYVAEPIRFNVGGTLLDAMKRAHADKTDWTVQVVLRESKNGGNHSGGDDPSCLLAMIRLSGKQASVFVAQRALAYLAEWNPSQGHG